VIFVQYFKQSIENKVDPYDSWVRTRCIPTWICTFFSEYKLFARDCVVEGVYLFSSIPHNVASSSTRTTDFIVFKTLSYTVRVTSRITRNTQKTTEEYRRTERDKNIKIHKYYEIKI